jgi:hypothetical protein
VSRLVLYWLVVSRLVVSRLVLAWLVVAWLSWLARSHPTPCRVGPLGADRRLHALPQFIR